MCAIINNSDFTGPFIKTEYLNNFNDQVNIILTFILGILKVSKFNKIGLINNWMIDKGFLNPESQAINNLVLGICNFRERLTEEGERT